MLVELYVYDLSMGMARELSASLTGVQIDAIYHTGIVFGGVEYTYDGGVQAVRPGTPTRPMQIVRLGETHLPEEVILEYLESLKEIYTHDAYDLWTHNCNSFSNDFSTFLVGKGIPSYITNLPQTVLNTPFGRMIKAQVDEHVRRQQREKGGLLGIGRQQKLQSHQQMEESIRRPSTLHELRDLLAEAKNSCAVVFFTSATCGPCKSLYPLYNELAVETGHKAVLIMVDIKDSFETSAKFEIQSTPTFITFLHGNEDNRWVGADPSTLRGNVRTLVQMAWPPHPHDSLRLPALFGSNTKPVLFSKVPPLEKLKAKMGTSANDPSVKGLIDFVSARNIHGPAESTLPDLDKFGRFLHSAELELPSEIMFTIVDLLRVAIVDPRLSGYYAEEKDQATIGSLLIYVNSLKDCPYSLRLVTLQTACNLFSSSLYPQHILTNPILSTPIVQLIATSLLDDKHHNVRVAAASLCFNIAVANNSFRSNNNSEGLPEGEQIELVASLLEAIGVEEESPEALKGFLLAFGFFVYRMPRNGELVDLLKSMDAQGTVSGKKKLFPKEALVKEIGEELLRKSLD